MWHVYILKCKDDSYYVGLTTAIVRRLKEHCAKGCHHTASRLPVKLVYSEEYSDRSIAAKREKQLKGWSRIKKEYLIDGKWGKQVS